MLLPYSSVLLFFLQFCGAKLLLFSDICKRLTKKISIFSSFLAILLFQRSFRSFLKYRTIVLYLLSHLTRFIQSFIRSLVNRSSFSSPLPYRAQLLFIFCVIHLSFLPASSSFLSKFVSNPFLYRSVAMTFCRF